MTDLLAAADPTYDILPCEPECLLTPKRVIGGILSVWAEAPRKADNGVAKPLNPKPRASKMGLRTRDMAHIVKLGFCVRTVGGSCAGAMNWQGYQRQW